MDRLSRICLSLEITALTLSGISLSVRKVTRRHSLRHRSDCNITAQTVDLLRNVNAQIHEIGRVFTDARRNASTRAIADLKKMLQVGIPLHVHVFHPRQQT